MLFTQFTGRGKTFRVYRNHTRKQVFLPKASYKQKHESPTSTFREQDYGKRPSPSGHDYFFEGTSTLSTPEQQQHSLELQWLLDASTAAGIHDTATYVCFKWGHGRASNQLVKHAGANESETNCKF